MCPCFSLGFCSFHRCSRGLLCPLSFSSSILNSCLGLVLLTRKPMSRHTWSLLPMGLVVVSLSHRIRQMRVTSLGHGLPRRPLGMRTLGCRKLKWCPRGKWELPGEGGEEEQGTQLGHRTSHALTLSFLGYWMEPHFTDEETEVQELSPCPGGWTRKCWLGCVPSAHDLSSLHTLPR